MSFKKHNYNERTYMFCPHHQNSYTFPLVTAILKSTCLKIKVFKTLFEMIAIPLQTDKSTR